MSDENGSPFPWDEPEKPRSSRPESKLPTDEPTKRFTRNTRTRGKYSPTRSWWNRRCCKCQQRFYLGPDDEYQDPILSVCPVCDPELYPDRQGTLEHVTRSDTIQETPDD